MHNFPSQRMAFALAAVFAFVLAFTPFTQAQDVAAITGVVTDPSGAVVPGASITLQDTSTGAIYKALTNSQGSYILSSVLPGPGYTLTVAHSGFHSAVITGLYMNVNATRTQNATLQVGNTTQTVEVSAASENQTINTTDATIGNNLEISTLNYLPVENRSSPSALFYDEPGVTLAGAVTGARTDQSDVTLDGLDVNDMATGQFGTIVGNAPVDSVQEFRGVVGQPLSSAGEGGGGQYELVTRSGTNHFHGNLNEYHRDTDTEANNWFNNDAGVPRPPLIRNQFGGNIGGPIRRDKAFFFFDWNSRRDTLSRLVERTVPMAAMRNGEVSYVANEGQTETLSSSQVAALDPRGIGFDPDLLKVIDSRYPAPNDFSGNYGDLINTAGFRFNAPYPYKLNDYIGRVDYTLTANQRLWGRVTFTRENTVHDAIQYPGDPETHPFLDKSYAWVVGHDWVIGSNKTNQVSYGETYENYSFPDTYNVTGVNQFSFGGIPSGGEFMSAPYSSAVNAQGRTYPIPVIRDDFAWTRGNHQYQFGGTFKYINPGSYTYLDYNQPTVGLGGHLASLNASMRPSDIEKSSSNEAAYDAEYTFALGRYASVDATYNYDANGNAVPQGTGSSSDYRYYETELYFGDTWKLRPNLTVSYGVRWQNYSVPYEVHGIESLPSLDFNQLFGARVAQSAAGAMGPSTDCNSTAGAGVPCVNYILGGKANHGPGYFQPQYDNFAPRIGFAWSPGHDPRSVFRAGAGIVYDHTVVNAIQYQASQYSYLFQADANRPFGSSNPAASLENDPRFSSFTSPPAPAAAPSAIKAPYTPWVSDGVPYGLADGGAFNEGVDSHLRTPYSIEMDFGFQHQFPGGLILKADYLGRLGRRLLGQADANQLIDFPDKASGQMMSTAFVNMEEELRSGAPITPQPWFEDILPSGLGAELGYSSNTDLVAEAFDPLTTRGDFADTVEYLSYYGLLPDNVGMGSQFSEFTYYTNLGFSGYNGMLVTLHGNPRHGLAFDLNYTWSHSIDNVSVVANAPAMGGYGFICDVLHPRECRGNSDFDVTSYLNGNFVYQLPFGRGRSVAASAPFWLNEAIGGWEVSGMPVWHTGNAFFAASNAYVAGYANDAPAILTGPTADLKMHIHKDASGTLWAFKTDNAPATADFTGPVGLQVGSRNNLRGPNFFNLDASLGKDFPIYGDRWSLRFRCDAFNALNHPNFSVPSNDITETSGPFGIISSTNAPPSSDQSARVLQGSLRLEF